MERYMVGGYVRDGLLGIESKDIDFTVVMPGHDSIDAAWSAMMNELNLEGFKVFLETKEFLTARAKFPKDHPNRNITADFVLARKEGPYSDQRHPDWVKPGSLYDDLARRDFTVNAMAKGEDGILIDPFGGQRDLETSTLRAVGNAKDRLLEDPLRVFRAMRFAVTKGLSLDPELRMAMSTMSVIDAAQDVSKERIREELYRMFKHSTGSSMSMLVNEFPIYLSILDYKGIWLRPTLEERRGS